MSEREETKEKSSYPSPFAEAIVDRLSIKELNALALSATIREKTDWTEKILDESIVAKWRQEVADIGDDVFKFALDDAKWRMETRRVAVREGEPVVIEDAAVHGVVQGVRLISSKTDEQLKEVLGRISSSLDYKPDYHPGSSNQVVNYLHPSLFPYVKGVSRRTPQRSPHDTTDWANFSAWALSGTPENPPRDSDAPTSDEFVSEKFQWLPTEVTVNESGDSARFTSYVNNLHPVKDRQFVDCLEGVVTAMIPLFEQCLGHLDHPWEANDPYVACMTIYGGENEEEAVNKGGKLIRVEDEGEYKVYMLPEKDVAFMRPDSQGEAASPSASSPSPPPPPPYFPSLANSNLQVILKVAETVLAPGESYPGGSWHVEGMENEAIVCTGIYYQLVENLSESRLRFRTKVDEYYNYEQNDTEGFERTYGLPNDEGEYPLCQELGHVKAREGLCIAFPNVYQHRVDPFHLLDPTKPGLRRTVVCFLVDPRRPRPISTSSVAPQQIPIALDAFQTVSDDRLDRDTSLACVVKMNGLYGRDKAEEYRLELMKERRFLQDKANSDLYERTFSLCEH